MSLNDIFVISQLFLTR